MHVTEKFHLQIVLLLQLTVLVHQLLLKALQRPAISHLWVQRTEDLHVFHKTYLVQTWKGHFFFISMTLGLVGAILSPFCPTQNGDDGLTALGMLLKLKYEIPVALKLSFQVIDFLFQVFCIIWGIDVLTLIGSNHTDFSGKLTLRIQVSSYWSWALKIFRRILFACCQDGKVIGLVNFRVWKSSIFMSVCLLCWNPSPLSFPAALLSWDHCKDLLTSPLTAVFPLTSQSSLFLGATVLKSEFNHGNHPPANKYWERTQRYNREIKTLGRQNATYEVILIYWAAVTGHKKHKYSAACLKWFKFRLSKNYEKMISIDSCPPFPRERPQGLLGNSGRK